MKIPTLFKRDPSGLVMPELAEGTAWMLTTQHKVTPTILMDGLHVDIEWDIPKSQWKITVAETNHHGAFELPADSRELLDTTVWSAFRQRMIKESGSFVVYGKGISGNHHNLDETLFVKLTGPINYNLIIRDAVFDLASVEKLYLSIEAELRESSEIYGLVFLEEDNKFNVLNRAKIKRSDFGFKWPVQQSIEQYTYKAAKAEAQYNGYGWD